MSRLMPGAGTGHEAERSEPTALGNTLGGVTLVAALNHAQVVGGKR